MPHWLDLALLLTNAVLFGFYLRGIWTWHKARCRLDLQIIALRQLLEVLNERVSL